MQTNINNKVVLDLKAMAIDLYAFLRTLKYETVQMDYEKYKPTIIYELENLLSNTVRLWVELNIHPLIRNYSLIRTYGDPAAVFSSLFNVEQKELENAINETGVYNLLMRYINDATGSDTYNMWRLTQIKELYFLECFGDFRIYTWEKEHIVNGIYRP